MKGSVAQLVVRQIPALKVVGSIPAWVKVFFSLPHRFLLPPTARGRRGEDTASNASFRVLKFASERKIRARASRVIFIRFLAFHFLFFEHMQTLSICCKYNLI